MKGAGVFSVHTFAKLSRTTRYTLHHYEKIGLLAPVSRGKNSYRAYANGQLALINVIRTLQALGMPLADIKAFMDRRAPDRVDALLSGQFKTIDEKIEHWVRLRQLLLTLRMSIRSVANIDERAIAVRFLPAETIALGDPNDYSNGRNEYDALSSFYRDMRVKYPTLDRNYPVWAVHAKKRIRQGVKTWPERYYYVHPDGHEQRPAAHYAIGYTRGRYGQNTELFERLVEYIDRNGFEISGDAYEEYPLNELSVANETQYLIRIMITVSQKT